MKVLQIAPCFVDLYKETGGVANIIRQICLSLNDNKIPTVLICSNMELGKEVAQPEINCYSKYLTIHVIKQHKHPLLGPRREIKSFLTSNNDFTIVHIHTCFSTLTDYSLRHITRNNMPCVFTPHGKLSPSMFGNKRFFKDLYFNLFLRKPLNKVSRIVTSSSNEIDYIKDLGINSTFAYVYNGYKTTSKKKESKYFNFGLKTKSYILFLGYLDSRKQPDLLIRAYKRSKAFKNFKLVLAGPDSYSFKESLLTLMKSLNIEKDKNIIFTGRVAGENKWSLLKNAKALFLPSKGEGWPVVIAEAIGAEIPSVISKGCNFSEIEKMKIGLEIRDFNIDSWINAIDEICFNQELNNIFVKKLNQFKDHFSWSEITQQWLDIYKLTSNESRVK